MIFGPASRCLVASRSLHTLGCSIRWSSTEINSIQGCNGTGASSSGHGRHWTGIIKTFSYLAAILATGDVDQQGSPDSRSGGFSQQLGLRGYPVPVVSGAAEQHLVGAGATQVEMRGVLPRETDSTVDLDVCVRCVAKALGTHRLGHAGVPVGLAGHRA